MIVAVMTMIKFLIKTTMLMMMLLMRKISIPLKNRILTEHNHGTGA